jgi:hypothetical protein
MKRLSLFLLVFLLFSTVSTFQFVSAQDKSKEELDKEVKIQQAIEKQKKVMAEKQKSMEDARQSLIGQQIAVEDTLTDLWVDGRRPEERGTGMRYFGQRGSRPQGADEPFVMFRSGESMFGHSMGDSERTSWDLSKSVKESSFSKEYLFVVEKTSKTFVMSVMGDCKTGEISIKVITPGGKTYSDILIDEFGNLNWRKSFNISETENQDKAGEWKFKIDSNKATGFFGISLQTY